MQLVLSTGNGVNGFTLDPSLGEFILTHPDIKVVLEVDPLKAQWDGLSLCSIVPFIADTQERQIVLGE